MMKPVEITVQEESAQRVHTKMATQKTFTCSPSYYPGGVTL